MVPASTPSPSAPAVPVTNTSTSIEVAPNPAPATETEVSKLVTAASTEPKPANPVTPELKTPKPKTTTPTPPKAEKPAPPKKETPIASTPKVEKVVEKEVPKAVEKIDNEAAEKKRLEEAAKKVAMEEAKKKAAAEKAQHVFGHKAWDALLRKYVSSSGKVDYKGFKSSKKQLDAYIMELRAHPVQSKWSREKQMVYWINAYNAFTIKLIVENYPVASITKLHGGKPWDVKWIEIGSNKYSLNNIENDILRPKFKDARIHFAVNCAAKSCPPILNRAWTESNMKSYFEKQAKAFINNSKYNKIAADKVQISKIFDWYGEDFGNIVDYLNKYSSTKINADAKVEYLDYNWSLNE